MNTKKYNSAPLPFMGQKRRFVKKLTEIVAAHPENTIYVDLFGGSGLVSHTVKTARPSARVIYNDFDNFRARLARIPETNALLAEIRKVVAHLPKQSKIPANVKSAILQLIRDHEAAHGYVDYLTLSSNLLFSMSYMLNFQDLAKETMYHCVRNAPYDASGYLEGVEFESADYKAVFEKYRTHDNVVWLVDPPYLSTESKAYDTYWKLRDYLDVLTVLDGTNYVYFTSNKSNIIELCEWIETRTFVGNPFAGSTTTTADVQMNYASRYTDIMLYKYDFKPTLSSTQ